MVCFRYTIVNTLHKGDNKDNNNNNNNNNNTIYVNTICDLIFCSVCVLHYYILKSNKHTH